MSDFSRKLQSIDDPETATAILRRRRIRFYLKVTIAYVVLWQLTVFACDFAEWSVARAYAARIGTGGVFFLGLAWAIHGLEQASARFESIRRARRSAGRFSLDVTAAPSGPHHERIYNPLDPGAWYYGPHSPRLNQSVTVLAGYSAAFMLLLLICSQVGGCRELYEIPAGGGQQQTIAQTVKLQKVIKKRYVINPFSAISFKVPPIDDVKLQLTEITEHAYTVGFGQGAGAGFAGGTNQGQVRFIRLEYAGGDWDQDYGIGSDVNMLIEYGIRTKQKVARLTESRTISELKNFPAEKSPPLVYLTGQKNISISDSEVKILRDYLLEKHGMIFGDNGGSGNFHNQFLGMMQR
ncbi:MAG: DUF4159 domain-containing protein, partial [Planctomycetaceae bacterium]